MILDSPTLMRKMPLIFYHADWKDKIPFVEKHGKYLKSVKFHHCTMRNTNELRRVLSLTPNLEELIISIHEPEEDAVDSTDDSNDIVISLQALKILSITSNLSLTKALLLDLNNCRSIEIFHVEAMFPSPTNEVGDFLSQQNNLKEISLRANGYDDLGLKTVFTENLINNKNIKLKTLKNYASLLYNKEFSEFLKAQSENIEYLYLKAYSIDFHYYRIILQNFHNLKKVYLHVNGIFNESRCAELAEFSLPSVTEFENREHIKDSWSFEALIRFFPNLEVITMPVYDFPFHGVLEKIPKLRKMKANDCKLEKLLFTKSLSMKELEMTEVDGMQLSFLWENLAENMPNIERLKIKNLAHTRLQITIDTKVKVFLMNLKNFKKLANVELDNDREDSKEFCDDSDNPEDKNKVQLAPIFKLSLKRKFDRTFCFKYSSYFNQHQMEAINEIKKNFSISEIIEEN